MLHKCWALPINKFLEIIINTILDFSFFHKLFNLSINFSLYFQKEVLMLPKIILELRNMQ